MNAWDQLLLKNGEKILTLNESVSSVRQDQQRLEHELDFVAGQQVAITLSYDTYFEITSTRKTLRTVTVTQEVGVFFSFINPVLSFK